MAYGRCIARFSGERWEALEGLGARRQRPLWAITGTKDPAYADVLYVERLIAPGVIKTMPEKTLHAFADHGDVGRALEADLAEAERIPAQPAMRGSTSPRSPPSSSARGSSRSATPTKSSFAASSRDSARCRPEGR